MPSRNHIIAALLTRKVSSAHSLRSSADATRKCQKTATPTRLFIKGVKKIAQKVGEEAVESTIEAVEETATGFHTKPAI